MCVAKSASNPNTAAACSARVDVIKLAKSLKGSHYLWGTAGAVPDIGGGNPGTNKEYGVNLVKSGDPNRQICTSLATDRKTNGADPGRKINDPANPAVLTAYSTSSGFYYVCAGRYDSSIPENTFSGGRIVNPNNPAELKELTDYLSTVTGATGPLYLNKFTPRMIIGLGGGGDVDENGLIVWAEPCNGVRHFDCIGFVNYCYQQVVPNSPYPWSFTIRGWCRLGDGDKPPTANAPTTDVSGQTLLAGDILAKSDFSHIALYAGDGDGSAGNPGTIVHAWHATAGVVQSAYNPGAWAYWNRLPDSYMKEPPAPGEVFAP
jgi:cell wall-associated NlpC family hydrolase